LEKEIRFSEGKVKMRNAWVEIKNRKLNELKQATGVTDATDLISFLMENADKFTEEEGIVPAKNYTKACACGRLIDDKYNKCFDCHAKGNWGNKRR
jgi:hypothetical protein